MADKVKIVVPRDVVTVEVNDNGDTIVLPVSDERFNQRLVSFVTKMQKETDRLNSLNIQDDIVATVNADLEFHTMLKEEFNALFGSQSYEKVFGDDIIIGAEYVLEFIDQIVPLIHDHMLKRTDKLSKYSAGRVGSVGSI